eukprot:jgi/Mesen1/10151/ME000076S09666
MIPDWHASPTQPRSSRHLAAWAEAGQPTQPRSLGEWNTHLDMDFCVPVLLGDMGAGKSSLVLRFVKGQFHEYQESTIGAAFLTQTVAVNDVTVKFEIWDTAGQERYHSLAPMYYRGAAAAVIADLSSKRQVEAEGPSGARKLPKAQPLQAPAGMSLTDRAASRALPRSSACCA